MKFQEYEYIHPDKDQIVSDLALLKERLKTAGDYEQFKKAFDDLDTLTRKVHTMETLCSIRHTVDTADEFYSKENDYFDEVNPVIENEMTGIYKIILSSPYADQLRQDIPQTWFKQVECAIASMSDAIVEDLIAENKAASSYQNLIASAKIPFDGKVYTLAGLEEKMNDKDREVRRAAHKAYWNWYDEHQEQIGDIYDQLVKIRTRMAQKMGFENYIPLAYLRMTRMDYDQKDVEQYRKNVLEDVVPVCQKLYEEQTKRLGFGDSLPAWDEKIEFVSGNPTPKHSRQEMVSSALKMYKELSPETGEFFQFMVDHDLLDLDSKPGKAAGGYCTYIPGYQSPFIFANFNKTQHDAEVLTHEAGHAFQIFSSRNITPFACAWPTMESAEIHSMSMEFFTWPWMKAFFEEDTDKFHYSHLAGAVKFLPYGVLVDHFQHEVYAHPQWSPKERMECWRSLEKQYLPHKDYQEIDVLENGGWWMKQLHIFLYPFYYIDYTLAQVCALQFWKRMQDQDPQAFEDYKEICKIGGTLPFKKIVESAHLKVPFEAGCLKDTMEAAGDWFEKQDASAF